MKTDSGIEYAVGTKSEETWSAYDSSVAKCHMANYGRIYLDPYGVPYDDESILEEVDDDFCKKRYESRIQSIMAELDCERETAEAMYERMCGSLDPSSHCW